MKWGQGLIKGKTNLGYGIKCDESRGLFQAKNLTKCLL